MGHCEWLVLHVLMSVVMVTVPLLSSSFLWLQNISNRCVVTSLCVVWRQLMPIPQVNQRLSIVSARILKRCRVTSNISCTNPIHYIRLAQSSPSSLLSLVVTPVDEEPVEDDKVVDLWHDLGEPVVFPQEEDEFIGGSVDSEVGCGEPFLLQHVFKEVLPSPLPLPRLVDVKVQNAHGKHLVLRSLSVKQEQLLLSDLQQPNDFVGVQVTKHVQLLVQTSPELLRIRYHRVQTLSLS